MTSLSKVHITQFTGESIGHDVCFKTMRIYVRNVLHCAYACRIIHGERLQTYDSPSRFVCTRSEFELEMVGMSYAQTQFVNIGSWSDTDRRSDESRPKTS